MLRNLFFAQMAFGALIRFCEIAAGLSFINVDDGRKKLRNQDRWQQAVFCRGATLVPKYPTGH